MRLPHRIAPVVALATLLVLGASACNGGKKDANSSTSTSTTSSTVATTTTRATTADAHCATTQLKATLGQPDAGAGQVRTPLVLTNTGSAACDLRGFPGVSLLDASGKQMGQPAGREGSEGTTVVLKPGGSATATLHTNSGIAGNCTGPSVALRIYPPDNTQAIELPTQYTACGTFMVTTLVAGTGN